MNILINKGLKSVNLSTDTLTSKAREMLIRNADGDGRKLLNMIEGISSNLSKKNKVTLDVGDIKKIFPQLYRLFDKKGDNFYDQISALHKSIRGSDPDASLYWFNRMLDGGIDPKYLARRLIRIASEDIGLADPRALSLTINASLAYDRLGTPEGELALAQATVFCQLLQNQTRSIKLFYHAKSL